MTSPGGASFVKAAAVANRLAAVQQNLLKLSELILAEISYLQSVGEELEGADRSFLSDLLGRLMTLQDRAGEDTEELASYIAQL